MVHTILVSILVFASGPSAAAQHVHPAPPASQARAQGTSTLSAEEVRQLLDGDGAGMAKAAEIHGYPGPKHILERAEHLGLTATQRDLVTTIRGRMLAEAQRLGRAIVEQEQALDAAFQSKAITREDLAARVSRIGALRAELRAVHLAAHLESVTALTSEQVHAYYQMGAHGAQRK